MSNDITGEEFGERVKERLGYIVKTDRFHNYVNATVAHGEDVIDALTYIGELEVANKDLSDKLKRCRQRLAARERT